eukprot:TRINITY_DN98_c0_g1_i1.p1 TRINITY_DN98_c0_g1~~TRINITY_DN98_c0_g1_i1.p1  ORF type:complete len:516 (-),score=77.26 TRINITY_DN98_c0_g1_i1:4001-5548(-)
MTAFNHHSKLLLVLLILLQCAKSYSQVSKKTATSTRILGSHKRSPRSIEDLEEGNGSRERGSAYDHLNVRRSSFSEPRTVLDTERESSDETDSGTDGKAEATDDDKIETDANTRQMKEEGEASHHVKSSAVQHHPSDNKERRDMIAKITKLLQRHRQLTRATESLRDLDLTASDKYHKVLRKRNALSQAWENAHRARLRVERDLDFFQTHSVLQDETLKQLESQTKASASQLEKLKNKHTHVLQSKAKLAEDFREHGLEHWVQNSVKGSVNPVVLDAIMQGTGYVVEPMLDGIEKLAAMNNEVASAVSRGLNEQSSLESYPFYSGFVSYTVLLCPLVIVTSLLTRLKKGISRLSRTSWIVVGTFYFFLITGGCLAATMLGSVDVLQTFRLHNVHMFNSLLVVHGCLYLLYALLHLYNVIKVPKQEAVSHFLVVSMVGVHSFIRFQKQSLSEEGLEVDTWAYFVYSAVFSFVLFEMVFRKEGSSRALRTKMMEAPQDDLKKHFSASKITVVQSSGD